MSHHQTPEEVDTLTNHNACDFVQLLLCACSMQLALSAHGWSMVIAAAAQEASGSSVLEGRDDHWLRGPSHLLMPTHCRIVQRCLAVSISCIDVSTSRQQHPHSLQLSAVSCKVQCRALGVIRFIYCCTTS